MLLDIFWVVWFLALGYLAYTIFTREARHNARIVALKRAHAIRMRLLDDITRFSPDTYEMSAVVVRRLTAFRNVDLETHTNALIEGKDWKPLYGGEFDYFEE